MDEAAQRARGGRDLAASAWGGFSLQPMVMGRSGVVAAGHYLAASAGLHILRAGGNAVDAGVAAGVCLNVALFHLTSFGGVAPIILYHRASDTLVTLDGLGVWPALADREHFVRHHGGIMPEWSILRAVTPGAPDAWLTALERFGTRRLGEVLEPAWELAARGVPVAPSVSLGLQRHEAELDRIDPLARSLFFPGGRALAPGRVLVQDDLAATFRALMDEEARARRRGLSREEAIRSARDLFYKGWIAERMAAFAEERGGWMRYNDLAGHRVETGTPLHGRYRDLDVYTCGPWSQGPLLIQFLNLMECFDLPALGHNSADYLHVLTEAMNLAFADRENYYGDPRFVEVPVTGLLSKAYARERAGLIQAERAFGRMPDPGNPWRHEPGGAGREAARLDVSRYLAPRETLKGDTSYVAVVDGEGNLFSATPSDPTFWTPMIPGLGFGLSGRGSQSRLEADHPASIAPGKRPRLTPNPAILMRDGQPLLAIGCPGGDAQTQAMLQVLLNLFEFGANVQEAIEAPRVVTFNFPNSFAPFPYHPGRLDVEARIPEGVRAELARRGHDVRVIEDWAPSAASVHIAAVNPVDGVRIGGADPRREGQALAW
ncbi:MAG TPA: gamma-glutamyltransferase family protein [Bacillota bacterium]